MAGRHHGRCDGHGRLPLLCERPRSFSFHMLRLSSPFSWELLSQSCRGQGSFQGKGEGGRRAGAKWSAWSLALLLFVSLSCFGIMMADGVEAVQTTKKNEAQPEETDESSKEQGAVNFVQGYRNDTVGFFDDEQVTVYKFVQQTLEFAKPPDEVLVIKSDDMKIVLDVKIKLSVIPPADISEENEYQYTPLKRDAHEPGRLFRTAMVELGLVPPREVWKPTLMKMGIDLNKLILPTNEPALFPFDTHPPCKLDYPNETALLDHPVRPPSKVGFVVPMLLRDYRRLAAVLTFLPPCREKTNTSLVLYFNRMYDEYTGEEIVNYLRKAGALYCFKDVLVGEAGLYRDEYDQIYPLGSNLMFYRYHVSQSAKRLRERFEYVFWFEADIVPVQAFWLDYIIDLGTHLNPDVLVVGPRSIVHVWDFLNGNSFYASNRQCLMDYITFGIMTKGRSGLVGFDVVFFDKFLVDPGMPERFKYSELIEDKTHINDWVNNQLANYIRHKRYVFLLHTCNHCGFAAEEQEDGEIVSKDGVSVKLVGDVDEEKRKRIELLADRLRELRREAMAADNQRKMEHEH